MSTGLPVHRWGDTMTHLCGAPGVMPSQQVGCQGLPGIPVSINNSRKDKTAHSFHPTTFTDECIVKP